MMLLHPSPVGGGWTRAQRAVGWGLFVVQDPTRPPAAVTLPDDGEG